MNVQGKNVRAKVNAESGNEPHRWFHLSCYQKDNMGWTAAIDFPVKARSEFTCCFACKRPINELVDVV
jgi:hypothetical protein